MNVRRLRFFALALLLGASAVSFAQFPNFPRLGNRGGGQMDDQTIGSGLKEALAVGTERAVKQVARPGGYLENAEIKILLPKNLQPVERVVRGIGQGAKIDEFVASMNHAAESAAPEAGVIFADAVRDMTIDDARRLLTGGDNSITEFFRAKTSERLTRAFRPHVAAAMDANGVTQQYNALQSRMPRLAMLGGGGGSIDITDYVVGRALDGLFFMLAQQEKEIRTNPAARSTALLRQVFGR